jgi:hypothetical protein
MNKNTGGSPPVRPDGLQIAEDRGFQEKFWRTERVALGVFALLVALALSGLLGAGGPLSVASISEPSARIEFPRVARWATEDQIVVYFAADKPPPRLVLGGDFLKWFHVDRVTPEPVRTALRSDDVLLTFASGEGDAFQALIKISPVRPGIARFTAAFNGGGPSELTSVILP